MHHVDERRRLILVADDDAEIREYFRSVLTEAGYGVLQATDGELAALLARTYRPDLVLMDVAMPIMDGLRAMELLRLDPRTEHLPVIAVSGYGLVGAAMRRAGFQAVLSKPVLAAELLSAVRCWIELAPGATLTRAVVDLRSEGVDP